MATDISSMVPVVVAPTDLSVRSSFRCSLLRYSSSPSFFFFFQVEIFAVPFHFANYKHILIPTNSVLEFPKQVMIVYF